MTLEPVYIALASLALFLVLIAGFGYWAAACHDRKHEGR